MDFQCDLKEDTLEEVSYKNDQPLNREDESPTFKRPMLFSCLKCEKKFTRAQVLKIHERTHTGDKPFSCSQCDYKFSTSCDLKRHERTHNGGKPFSCSLCNYKCTQLSNLKRHERTHTGDRPYSCGKCDKIFKQSSNLKKHEIKNHTTSAPSSFLAEIKEEPL